MFCQNILVLLNCIAYQIKTMNCLEFDNHGAGLSNLQAKKYLNNCLLGFLFLKESSCLVGFLSSVDGNSYCLGFDCLETNWHHFVIHSEVKTILSLHV